MPGIGAVAVAVVRGIIDQEMRHRFVPQMEKIIATHVGVSQKVDPGERQHRELIFLEAIKNYDIDVGIAKGLLVWKIKFPQLKDRRLYLDNDIYLPELWYGVKPHDIKANKAPAMVFYLYPENTFMYYPKPRKVHWRPSGKLYVSGIKQYIEKLVEEINGKVTIQAILAQFI